MIDTTPKLAYNIKMKKTIIFALISMFVALLFLNCTKKTKDTADVNPNTLSSENIQNNEKTTDLSTLEQLTIKNQSPALLGKKVDKIGFDDEGASFNQDYYSFKPIIKKMKEYLYSTDESSQNKPILTERYGMNPKFPSGPYALRSFGNTNTRTYLQTNNLFLNAIQFYNNNEISKAIELIEMAIETIPVVVYYYHYGAFLMDIKDFENAERAFYKAFQFIPSDYSKPFYDFSEDEWGLRNNIYSFDDNGAPREAYFALYNLACIYSLKNEFDKSYDFLVWSVEFGYPYINHLVDDPDLSKLFNSDIEIKNKIIDLYQKGFVNDLSGKTLDLSYVSYASMYLAYKFENDNVTFETNTHRLYEYTLKGTYTVRNYNILCFLPMNQEVKAVETQYPAQA